MTEFQQATSGREAEGVSRPDVLQDRELYEGQSFYLSLAKPFRWIANVMEKRLQAVNPSEEMVRSASFRRGLEEVQRRNKEYLVSPLEVTETNEPLA